jgi:hypothetical protein
MTVHAQVGLGVAIDVPVNVSNDMMMDALVMLYSKPNEFELPVTNVITRPSSDGLGESVFQVMPLVMYALISLDNQ